MSKLNSKRVDQILTECLFREGEDTSNALVGKGVITDFGFHPERIEQHRSEVAEMLAELPDQFHEDKGGGWSFLNACMDREGNQWGEHISIEGLLALGSALGMAKTLMPKEMWGIFPGGMPYFSVNPPVKHEVAP
jgi:hypothetical protein